jgi:lactate dehydrogenase-like 2-hydroxyacid dehydrogenase
VNTIDLAVAKSRGIAVADMPRSNSHAITELTPALMLASPGDNASRLQYARRLRIFAFDRIGEISGKIVGFVGFGEVPKRVARAVAALGGRVNYTTRMAMPVGRF